MKEGCVPSVTKTLIIVGFYCLLECLRKPTNKDEFRSFLPPEKKRPKPRMFNMVPKIEALSKGMLTVIGGGVCNIRGKGIGPGCFLRPACWRQCLDGSYRGLDLCRRPPLKPESSVLGVFLLVLAPLSSSWAPWALVWHMVWVRPPHKTF